MIAQDLFFAKETVDGLLPRLKSKSAEGEAVRLTGPSLQNQSVETAKEVVPPAGVCDMRKGRNDWPQHGGEIMTGRW
jgi:hypothetical protein